MAYTKKTTDLESESNTDNKVESKPFITDNGGLVQKIWQATARYSNTKMRFAGGLSIDYDYNQGDWKEGKRIVVITPPPPKSMNEPPLKQYTKIEYRYKQSKEEIEQLCIANGNPLDIG